MEALLASEDYGKDLASVNNLLKKHQLLEADISAHEVRPRRALGRLGLGWGFREPGPGPPGSPDTCLLRRTV